MKPTIIELIVGDQAAKAVSIVEKTLAKKLRKLIFEHKSVVAREAYGSLEECFGADEVPEFMETGDNAYQFFFQNALKKFGVNGPHDFQDDNTKNQFFQYVDQNWKAQDAFQPQSTTAGIDLGTGTQLPTPATKPMAPPVQPQVNPMQPQVPGSVDPSVATMNSGPTQSNPMQQDQVLPQQPVGVDQTDEPLVGDEDGAVDGDAFGDDPDAMDDDGSDPDLEIGDDDVADDGTDFTDEPEDEQGMGTQPDSDSEFDDEDAYSVDHSDFMPKDDDQEDDDDDSEDDSDDDEAFTDDDDSSDQDDDDSDESDDDDESDEFDPDLDISDDDSDDDDDEDSDDVPNPNPKSKNNFAKEDYGFGQDNADDQIFITERSNFFKKAKNDLKQNPDVDPDSRKAKLAAIDGGMKKHSYIQRELDKIKSQRDAMLKQLRQQRGAIKGDATKDPDDKKAALQQLAQMAGESRQFFKKQALALKALHLQQDGGGNDSDDQDQALPQKDTKQDKVFPPKQKQVTPQDTDDDLQKPQGKKPFPPVKESFVVVEDRSGHTVKITGSGPYSSRMFIGEQATKVTANHKTLKGAQQWAANVMRKQGK